MRLGKDLVLVWWAPITRLPDNDDDALVFEVERPRLHFKRNLMRGLIRWSARVGWVELRQHATDAEIAAMFP